MGVLNVIDRVLRRFFLGQFQVEFHLGGRGPGQEEEPASVHTDLIGQLFQGHQVAGPFGEPHSLESHHLGYEHGQAVSVDAQRFDRRFHPRDVALVVCSPDVHHGVKAPFDELAVVIGDVRGEVGWLAVRPDHNVVFVVAEHGGVEPGCAFPLR